MVKLYGASLGSPTRSVLLTAEAIGLKLEIIEMDLMNKGEHKTPEFLKINPQHTVPALDDNGFYLAESRAIMKYLVEAHASEKSLYPEDIKQRALINARMDFEGMSLYPALRQAYINPFFTGSAATENDIEAVKDKLSILDTLIGNKDYLVGDKLTLADLCIAALLVNFEVVNYDFTQHPNVDRYYKHCKKVVPGFDKINTSAIGKMQALLNAKKQS